ncbi:MAG: hemolysin III family protein [Rhodanobacteraceae bacterium]
MSITPAETAPSSYSATEEIASSVIHGIGIVLSIAGLAVLAAHAAPSGDVRHIASVGVYGSTLILLYTASTLYHGVPIERAKPLLRQLDHAAIFLLIAGTYTPFTLITLEGAWGWSLFAIVWTLALTGVWMVVKRIEKRGVTVALYVGLGWIGLIAIGPLVRNLPAGGLWLLFGGGVCYTLGVPFYLSRRLRFNHALWHVFVLAGSILQFFAVLFYVLPGQPAG